MSVTIWLMILFFLVWIGYDTYTVVTDVQMYGISRHVLPIALRALWGILMFILFMSITLS